MTNWKDPVEMQKDLKVFGAFTLVLMGVAVWDVVSTLEFDISIIRGKRKWRWPMAIYFLCRICLLLHAIPMAVQLNALSEIPCMSVIWPAKFADTFGTCLSSIILLLRTVAVWHQNKFVIGGLSLMSCGQFVLWCQTLRYSKTAWNAQRNVCQVLETAPNALIVSVFTFTMAFDFIIMVLCTFRLYKSRNHGGIGALLFRDGIIYFLAAFSANLVQTVMAALALNPIMNIICLPFALVVSAIAATRVFRNVFTAYDDFSKESGPGASGSVSGNIGTEYHHSKVHTMGRNKLQLGNSKVANDTFALGEVRSQPSGQITVHRVVDVDVDLERGEDDRFAAESFTPTKSVLEDDNFSVSTSGRDEKKPRGF